MKRIKKNLYGQHQNRIPSLALLFLASCAADPSTPSSPTSLTNSTLTQQNIQTQNLSGATVTFYSSDYYTTTSPSPWTGCAGDANKFYDPFALGPVPLATSLIDPNTTIRPSFIKNVSIDITDSNSSNILNNSRGCSYGNGPSSPPASTCATFDTGAAGSIPSTLGGTLLILGGLSSTNSTGTISCGENNLCPNSTYVLSVATPPNSTTPLSTWEKISASLGYSGPLGAAGSASSYDGILGKMTIFGGASPLSSLGSSEMGSTNYDTWIFDVKTQTWSAISAHATVPSTLQNTTDASNTLPKLPGARALFGYTSASGMAISHLSTTGNIVGAGGSGIDTTDRVWIVGGLCTNGACSDSHQFNPTYGPEYWDGETATSPVSTLASLTAPAPTQWIDSYYQQILSNTNSLTQLLSQTKNFAAAVAPNKIITSYNFGMISINNNNDKNSLGLGVSTVQTGTSGAGYILMAGGFSPGKVASTLTYNIPTLPNINTPLGLATICPDLNSCGGMQMSFKWNSKVSQAAETVTANGGQLANWKDSLGSQATPLTWGLIPPSGALSDATPWFGGSVLLKGINLAVSAPAFDPYLPAPPPAASQNQAVFFGGSNCSDYLTDSTNCIPVATSPGRYWVLGTDPAGEYNGAVGSNYPSTVAFGGSPPTNAGMAAARGTDLNNNPLIVAWGGMSSPATPDSTGNIYYLYNNAGVPTWATATTTGGPPGLGNASLVFSHTTGKFYLFGGYSPSALSSNATWALSLTAASASCGISGSCNFTWTALSPTCYPATQCPSARRSHRMVEVNYNYFNAPSEPVCTSDDAPCSFGIFMEGGTGDGTRSTLYSDRWMFDPTANSGTGHWQLMGELPPRTLAALSNVDYTTTNGTAMQLAVLFGGETGMLDGSQAIGQSGYFVPPTLGDTWMFDYNTLKWNRVTLYGKRYDATIPATLSVEDTRAASLVSDTTTQILSPPPLSGAIMVTRTVLRTNHSPNDTPKTLSIPEIFLFGGRTKDGKYNLLNNVYKFCAGSTGEKPSAVSTDDASCDAYDVTNNPLSTSPSSQYVGRWLLKTPSILPATLSSYLGAGTYDSLHDRILLWGGFSALSAAPVLTGVTNSSSPLRGVEVLEYTPPTSSNTASLSSALNGSFLPIGLCTGSGIPTLRYGHSLSYNAQNKSLLIVGGYNSVGSLLTSSSGGPDIWTALRDDTNNCYTWTQITSTSSTSASLIQTPPSTGLAHMATAFIPSSGYNTGYYSTFDNSCINSGPISSTNPLISGILAGGAYFDIDRTQLGSTENLILNLTFIPMGLTNNNPLQTKISQNEIAIFKVHLVKTGQTGDQIRQIRQPRYLTYAATDQYPEIAPNISIITPPNGQIRQEQIYIPLSIDPGIDRIRIERYSGNAILIDATLMRLGHN